MSVEVLSLGSEACLDALQVGDKAATLAAALRHGLPVLAGLVVPVQASMALLDEVAAEIDGHGVHAARLAVMESTTPDLSDLPARMAELGGELIVRSSSPLEDAPEYAGTFTSYLGVTSTDLPTAVRGVWASALVDRPQHAGHTSSPGTIRMAVLVQPQIYPRFAGTAQVAGGGAVTVIAVAGSPAPLLAGWARGETAVASVGGVAGAAAIALASEPLLGDVGALARRVLDVLGNNLIEWAATRHGVVLLQAKRAATPPAPMSTHASASGTVPPAAAGVARMVHAFAGELGEALVLPAALAGVRPDTVVPAAPPRPAVTHIRASSAWSQALALAPSMRAGVWGAHDDGGAGAAAVVARLREGAVAEATDHLSRLPQTAGADLEVLLGCLAAVAAWLLQNGALTGPEDLWAVPPGAIAAHFAGVATPAPAKWHDARRRAALRWEPLVYTAIRDTGVSVHGEAAGAGTGSGPAVTLRGLPTQPVTIARMVLVAPQPIPQLAPLLWGASALVTTGGSAAAHLVEVARSRGVPVVLGCDQERLFALLDAGADGRRPTLVAVDGDSGRVVVDALAGGRGDTA